MSNTIIKTVLNSGSKSILLHVYMESDGSEGELKDYPLIDRTIYDPSSKSYIQPNMKLTVSQIWNSFSWFDALLSFGNLVPAPSWLLARDSNNYIDFRHFGGIADRLIDPNTSESTERTGKILISTNGFAPLGSMGTMILEIKRDLN